MSFIDNLRGKEFCAKIIVINKTLLLGFLPKTVFMICWSGEGSVPLTKFVIRMEFPGELARRFSSATLTSIPIPTVMIVVVVLPANARFFSKFACACN